MDRGEHMKLHSKSNRSLGSNWKPCNAEVVAMLSTVPPLHLNQACTLFISVIGLNVFPCGLPSGLFISAVLYVGTYGSAEDPSSENE